MRRKPRQDDAMMQYAGIEKLKECLRCELSAMETYELALKHVTHVGLHAMLQEIFVSHARRADLLSEKIGWLGVEVPASSGTWGAFAKTIQAGADLLGDRVATAALEQGEDRALELYMKDLDACDAYTRKTIVTELLAEERRTHDLCHFLKDYANAPS